MWYLVKGHVVLSKWVTTNTAGPAQLKFSSCLNVEHSLKMGKNYFKADDSSQKLS